MKKIYIHGSYSTANFGDCLLYGLLKDSITDYMESTNQDIDIVSDNVSDFCYNFSPVHRVKMLTAVLSADAIVCGGGGFLGEPKPHNKYWDRHCLCYHVFPLWVATILRKPIAIIGTEVGPISNKFILSKIKRIVSSAVTVAVRNEESKIFLEQITKKGNILSFPDWVMTTRTENYRNKSDIVENPNRIFFHIGYADQNRISIIAEDIKMFLEQNSNFEIIIGGDSLKPQAIETCKYIHSQLSDYGAKYYEYRDPNELIEMIDTCHYVITTKLHVGILSIRLGKSVLPLTIHPKIRRFYHQIGYPEKYINELSSFESSDFYRLLDAFLSEDYHVEISKLIKSADSNEKELVKFLDKVL